MDSGNGTSDIVRNKSGLREQVHFSRNTSSWSGPNHVFRNNTTYFSLRLLVVLVGGGGGEHQAADRGGGGTGKFF